MTYVFAIAVLLLAFWSGMYAILTSPSRKMMKEYRAECREFDAECDEIDRRIAAGEKNVPPYGPVPMIYPYHSHRRGQRIP